MLNAALCLAAAAATAQVIEPPRKSAVAVRVEAPPVLDGVLDDAAWGQAAVVEDLHVVVSNEYGTPGERSRIYVAFDDDNLYFAARFFDSKPETIVAKVLSKRDVSFGEDGFSITLDPFDQARTGYMFDVNPNGMRSEAIYTDKDRQNWDWEGIWDAASRIDGEGWTAEVAIPLKTLSFDPARDAWGVNFTRWHGVDSEQYGWMSYNRAQDLSRTGLVTGLAGLQQGHGLDVVPGLRTGTTRNHETDEEDDFLEPSLDVFWKITPSLTAAATLNPDFSGTTADTRQINLTRFDLFFPEQRAFFLQDSDIFQFAGLEGESGIPFFSRRIGLDDEGEALTLDAGLKLAGRAGPLSVGVLGVRQDAATGPDSVDLFVGRVAVNVLEESSIGAIVTSGNPDPNVDNSLVGVDFRYLNTRIGEDRTIEATAWYQQTDTEGLEDDDSGYGFSFCDAEQRGLERRDRPQGPRGELLPGARLRGAHRFRGDVRRPGLHVAPGKQLGPERRDGNRRRVRRADQRQRPQSRDRGSALRGGKPDGGQAGVRLHLRRRGIRRRLRDLRGRRDPGRHLQLRSRLPHRVYGRAANARQRVDGLRGRLLRRTTYSCSRQGRPGGRASTSRSSSAANTTTSTCRRAISSPASRR